MSATNQIGIETTKAQQLADQLNLLLANHQVFYINTRGFHWNITGEHFFELHAKFEELYNNLIEKIDEIAERIVTLGYTPLHSFSDFIKVATIQEVTNVSDGKEAVRKIVDAFQNLLTIEREIKSIADEANDEGTSALMSDYIRQKEKLVWMYSAFLK